MNLAEKTLLVASGVIFWSLVITYYRYEFRRWRK